MEHGDFLLELCSTREPEGSSSSPAPSTHMQGCASSHAFRKSPPCLPPQLPAAPCIWNDPELSSSQPCQCLPFSSAQSSAGSPLPIQPPPATRTMASKDIKAHLSLWRRRAPKGGSNSVGMMGPLPCAPARPRPTGATAPCGRAVFGLRAGSRGISAWLEAAGAAAEQGQERNQGGDAWGEGLWDKAPEGLMAEAVIRGSHSPAQGAAGKLHGRAGDRL